MSKLKQVIVMRKDLNMRKGKMIAQGAHASCNILMKHYDNPIVKKWASELSTKICVYVNSEEELFRVYNSAKKAHDKQNRSIPCSLICDSGLTEFGGVPTYTCCAIGPSDSDTIDLITGDLPLL